MTNAESKTLQRGDKVVFLGDRMAEVLRVCGNGVRIMYDGRGNRAGQLVVTRAAARNLTKQ